MDQLLARLCAGRPHRLLGMVVCATVASGCRGPDAASTDAAGDPAADVDADAMDDTEGDTGGGDDALDAADSGERHDGTPHDADDTDTTESPDLVDGADAVDGGGEETRPTDAMDTTDAPDTESDTEAPAPVPCEGGTCCVDGWVAPRGTACREQTAPNGSVWLLPRETERRCAADGSGIEWRQERWACDGVHPYCRFDLADVVVGEWELELECACTDEEFETITGSFMSGVRCDDVLEEEPTDWRDLVCTVQSADGSWVYKPARYACSGTRGTVRDHGLAFCEGDRIYTRVHDTTSGRMRCTGSDARCGREIHEAEWAERYAVGTYCTAGEEVCVQDPEFGVMCEASDRACVFDHDGLTPCCEPWKAYSAAGSYGTCEREERRCNGRAIQQRTLFNECTGTSSLCATVSSPSEWVDVAVCEPPYTCDDATLSCVMPDDGCFAGRCCDPETYTWPAMEGVTCRETRFEPALERSGVYYGDCVDEDTGFLQYRTDYTCVEGVCVSDRRPDTYDCPAGTLCYDIGPDWELQGQCVGGDLACDPDEPCCNDFGWPRPEGYVCSDALDTRESCRLAVYPEARTEGLFGVCTGASGACSLTVENLEWRGTGLLDVCRGSGDLDGECVVDGGEAFCIVEGAVPCDAGACCDAGYTRPRGTRCGVDPVVRETRCNDTRTGIETRTASQGCTGVSGSCSDSSTFYVWSAWTASERCGDAFECAYGSGAAAGCFPVPEPCETGACCDTGAGLSKPAGSSCDVRWRIERECSGDAVVIRDIDYACNGGSADCPRSRSLTVAGPWYYGYDCPGCHYESGTVACLDPGEPSSPDACGAPCLIDATCANGNCEGGQCAPAECAACWATGASCATTSTCGYDGCVGGSGTSGCRANDEVIRVTGLRVADVDLPVFEARARVINYIGEPLERVDFYYEASPAGARLPSSTRVWVAVRGGDGSTWYVEQPTVVPPDRTWTTNVSGSPSWSGLFCRGPGRETTCMEADAARALVDEGICYTGVVVTAG